MSAADKKKLDGIAAGAAVTSVNNQTGAVSITPANIGAVAKSGDTMTGVLALKGSQYGGPDGEYGMNANNSDIVHVNAIYHNDNADNFSEGHLFYRSATTWDAMAANGGTFYFGSNVARDANLTGNATLKAGRLILTASQDASGTSANPVALIVGGEQTGYHLEFDGNEIIAKSDGTHGSTLYLNSDGGGNVYIGPGGLAIGKALEIAYGGTGATTAAGARTNLGIATTVTTVTTTGITSHGNWVSGLKPNEVVIDAAYCAAGTVAVTPYVNSDGKWAFHCIRVSTGEAYGTAFDLTIRYHNIY